MYATVLKSTAPASRTLLLMLIVTALAGCMLGPKATKPVIESPDDWTSWRSGDPSIRGDIGTDTHLPANWWHSYQDPTLNRLVEQALKASPDLQSTALRYAQARVQRAVTVAQRGPDVNANGAVNRQRQSEHGAGTRIIDAVGGNRDALIGYLSEPFTLYQAGFDVSWELDLWGRVRRSVEAADAEVANQAALLDLSRLSLISDVARSYFELRSTQENIRLTQQDIQALVERLELMQARLDVGAIDHIDIARQRTELAAARAQLPKLLAQEAASKNQLLLLIGERSITDPALDSSQTQNATPLPALSLGLPSEVATRRPDVRAAEARLYRATARIGVARADLYPSIRLGARGGLESYLSSEISDWGSRTWSIGPTLNLPLFDRGRLKGAVALRELEQQAAAVDYQRTVLNAWHEIDDALNAYEAERQSLQQQRERRDTAADAYELIKARYEGGVVDFSSVLDTQRNLLQARRDLAASEAQTRIKFATINKATGNVPAAVGDAGIQLSTPSH